MANILKQSTWVRGKGKMKNGIVVCMKLIKKNSSF